VNARYVGDDYQYFGADTGQKMLHYWTADSIDQVQHYFETFTYPFIDDPWKGGLVTVFSIDDAELIYTSIDGREYPLDFPTNKNCHYRQSYKCVNVNLLDLNMWIGKLPAFTYYLFWQQTHSLSPATSLPQGTLITYSYYIDDF
jgi:hypothetical protein